jgi:hypothetical protein
MILDIELLKAYRDLNNVRMAERYFKEHLKNRQSGIPSLYAKALVKKELSALQKQGD